MRIANREKAVFKHVTVHNYKYRAWIWVSGQYQDGYSRVLVCRHCRFRTKLTHVFMDHVKTKHGKNLYKSRHLLHKLTQWGPEKINVKHLGKRSEF